MFIVHDFVNLGLQYIYCCNRSSSVLNFEGIWQGWDVKPESYNRESLLASLVYPDFWISSPKCFSQRRVFIPSSQIMGNLCGCMKVDQSTVAIKEKFGKFVDVLEPGFHCVPWCLGSKVAGHLSLRVQQLDVRCETKTEVRLLSQPRSKFYLYPIRNIALFSRSKCLLIWGPEHVDNNY